MDVADDSRRDHLDENAALDLLAGRVVGSRAVAVEAHLERCSDCRRFVLQLARLSEHRATEPARPGGTTGDQLAADDRVDRYVIRGVLGAGGMGVVYDAHDPELDRRVAVKLLRPGTMAQAARERMAREARTLARLSHPNVVAVHDVGSHGDGMFIVMELVDGVTLKRWLADRKRGWREIVDVLVRAGRGLAAAHTAGLIDRDFKPDNVMIARDGRVLVTDFGLARPVTDADDTATEVESPGSPGPAAGITLTGGVVGTPAYMAPEQHGGEAGPAADQFAFCVTLYEALYGRRPFPGATVAELRAAIRTGSVEPPPSARAPARLGRIIARGLQLEPGERFPAMEPLLTALARDRRRRLAVIAIAAGAVALAITVTWLITRSPDQPATATVCRGADERVAAVWDAGARDKLRAAFTREGRALGTDAAARATERIDAYANGWRRAYVAACEATHVTGEQPSELLDRRMACLDGRLAEMGALVQIFTDADPGLVERAVGAITGLPAVADCANADALDDTAAPADPAVVAEVASVRADLARARALHNAGKVKAEEPLTRDVARRAEALAHPPLSAAAGYQLGRLEVTLGHAPEAIAALRVARLAAEASGNDRLKAEITIVIASVASEAVDRDKAEEMEREAGATLARLGTPPELDWLLADVKGKRRLAAGDYKGAITEFERSMGIAERLFTSDSYEVANLLNNIGACQLQLGDFTTALATHKRARAIREKVLGPDHPAVADSLQNMGNCLLVHGGTAEALPLYEQALLIMERGLGEGHVRLGFPLHNLGLLYLMNSELEKSAAYARRATDVFTTNLGADHPQAARARSRLAVVLAELGKIDEAKAEAKAALDVLIARLGADHEDTAQGHLVMGNVLDRAHDCAAAIPHYDKMLAIVAGTANELYGLSGLGRCEIDLHRPADAVGHLERAVAAGDQLQGADSPLMIPYLVDLGRALLEARRDAAAVAPLERALALDLANGDGTQPGTRADVRFHLARALWHRPADRPRAATLATEARDYYASIEPAPAELAEVKRWLASHSPP